MRHGPRAPTVYVPLCLVLARSLLASLFYAFRTCILSWILDVLLNSPSQSTLLPRSLDCFSLVTCRSSFRVSIGHLWSVNGELYLNISTPIEYGRSHKSNLMVYFHLLLEKVIAFLNPLY